MPYRNPNFLYDLESEKSAPTAVTLPASDNVDTIGITPKSSKGQSIMGLKFKIDMSVTQTTAATWQAADLFKGIEIVKGDETRLKIQSYNQLVRLFNALTGFDDSQTNHFSNGTSTGAVGQSTSTLEFFLPLQLNTAIIPQIVCTYNAFTAASGTAGTVTTQIAYYYSNATVEDDKILIVTTPTTLNSQTEIDISEYFVKAGIVDEVWVDVVTDTNLTEQTYAIGKTPIYPKNTPFELRAMTTFSPIYTDVDGFLKFKTQQTRYPANGVSADKPALLCNFAVPLSPTFYLFSKVSSA